MYDASKYSVIAQKHHENPYTVKLTNDSQLHTLIWDYMQKMLKKAE